MTGGSHAEARAIVPPRFAGLVLAAIQSGYSEAACPAASRGRAPTPPHPMRFRKLRRSTPWGRPSDLPRSEKDIVALLLGRTRERSTRRRRKEWSDGATRLQASQEWAMASRRKTVVILDMSSTRTVPPPERRRCRCSSFGAARLLTRLVEEDTRSPPSTRSRGGETLPAGFSRDVRSPIEPQGGPG